jgi:hypothetical protein
MARELEIMSRTRYVSPYGLAQIYSALNKKNDTFKWLQTAYDDHARLSPRAPRLPHRPYVRVAGELTPFAQ